MISVLSRVLRLWQRFPFLIFFFGILVPDAAFVLSSAVTPEWKGAAAYGVLSLLLKTKIVLLPLLPLANYALVVSHNVLRDKQPLPEKKRIFLWIGLLISVFTTGSFCAYDGGEMLFQLVPTLFQQGFFDSSSPFFVFPELLLSIPFFTLAVLLFSTAVYVPVWYATLLWKTKSKISLNEDIKAYAIAGAALSPFLVAAVIWAEKAYQELPDQAPSCFIATASMQGTLWKKGSRVLDLHGIHVSRQVVLCKALEFWIAQRAPRLHTLLRFVYNYLAPPIAQNIGRRPWKADVAYLLLKPLEYTALWIIRR